MSAYWNYVATTYTQALTLCGSWLHWESNWTSYLSNWEQESEVIIFQELLGHFFLFKEDFFPKSKQEGAKQGKTKKAKDELYNLKHILWLSETHKYRYPFTWVDGLHQKSRSAMY